MKRNYKEKLEILHEQVQPQYQHISDSLMCIILGLWLNMRLTSFECELIKNHVKRWLSLKRLGIEEDSEVPAPKIYKK